MKLILSLITSLYLLFQPLAQAAPFSGYNLVRVGFTRNADQTLTVDFPSEMGFFNVDPNTNKTGIYGLLIEDFTTHKQIKITADELVSAHQDGKLDADILFNQVHRKLSDPAQTTRRLKVKFHKMTFAATSDMSVHAVPFLCRVFLLNENGDVVSGMADNVTENSIPVEFSGGNGQPLTVYIENGFKFNNVDLGLYPDRQSIYLNFYKYDYQANKDNDYRRYSYYGHGLIEGLQGIAIYAKEGESKPVYQKDVTYDSNFIYRAHDLYIRTPQWSSLGHVTEAFSPIALKMPQAFRWPAPVSGWYTAKLVSANAGKYDNDKDFQVISDKAVIQHTPFTKQARELLFQGEPLQINYISNSYVKKYMNERFYVVSSIDPQGRIKLKKWLPYFDNTSMTMSPANWKYDPNKSFDFSKVENGDNVWWGNRVRWLINSNGKSQVQEGYIGYHDPKGGYGFVKPDNAAVSLNTLPKVGSLIFFENAKTVTQ
ncbi:MAG: hypothetical protein ACPGUD_05025 [Parashewanella sp.]